MSSKQKEKVALPNQVISKLPDRQQPLCTQRANCPMIDFCNQAIQEQGEAIMPGSRQCQQILTPVKA